MSQYGYLAHHGVKGQKWGIRRYQNEDGSLTDAGMRRYGVNKINNNPHKAGTAFGYQSYSNLHWDIVNAIKKENKGASKEEIEQKIKDEYRSIYPKYTDIHYNIGRSIYNKQKGINPLTEFGYIPVVSEKKMSNILDYRSYVKQLIKEAEKR